MSAPATRQTGAARPGMKGRKPLNALSRAANSASRQVELGLRLSGRGERGFADLP